MIYPLLYLYALCHYRVGSIANGGPAKPTCRLSATLPRIGLPYMGRLQDSVDPRDDANFVSISRIRDAELTLASLRVPGVLTVDARLLLAHAVLDSRSIRSVNIAAGRLAAFPGDAATPFTPDIDVW